MKARLIKKRSLSGSGIYENSKLKWKRIDENSKLKSKQDWLKILTLVEAVLILHNRPTCTA